VLERLVYPSLGSRQIDDIRRSDVARLLDRIADENGPRMADTTLAFIRRIMNWHASRSDDFRSPIVRGMARTKPSQRRRQRILSDEELKAIWRAAEAQRSPFGRLVQFLLLTATRRTEAAGMDLSEVIRQRMDDPGEAIQNRAGIAGAAIGRRPEDPQRDTADWQPVRLHQRWQAAAVRLFQRQSNLRWLAQHDHWTPLPGS
jgi:hypothetical protein